MPDNDVLANAQSLLNAAQQVDAVSLAQEDRLGLEMGFREAVPIAESTVKLFRLVPLSSLDTLPPNQITQIATSAEQFLQIVNRIRAFSAQQQQSANNFRQSLIREVRNNYQVVFDYLSPIIAFLSSQVDNLAVLQHRFETAIADDRQELQATLKGLQGTGAEADRVLTEVRELAAEMGVSQQAIYFRADGDEHRNAAIKWLTVLVIMAAVLIGCATLSLFFYNWFAPKTLYETAQLGLSKILIFSVLAYAVLLCSRNYLAHKHNETVNKHRQNALLTFRALVEAAASEERRDIILTYAASCIFSPQETGYTRATSAQSEAPLSIIQTLPNLVSGVGQPKS